jgi:hypothetical protein
MRFFTLAFLFASALSFADSPGTFTGVITDTMCGVKHTMVKDQSDDQCIKMCTKGSSEYALFDGDKVLKLTDQKTSAKFAAKRVVVTGVYNEKTKTIKVASMKLE